MLQVLHCGKSNVPMLSVPSYLWIAARYGCLCMNVHTHTRTHAFLFFFSWSLAITLFCLEKCFWVYTQLSGSCFFGAISAHLPGPCLFHGNSVLTFVYLTPGFLVSWVSFRSSGTVVFLTYPSSALRLSCHFSPWSSAISSAHQALKCTQGPLEDAPPPLAESTLRWKEGVQYMPMTVPSALTKPDGRKVFLTSQGPRLRGDSCTCLPRAWQGRPHLEAR